MDEALDAAALALSAAGLVAMAAAVTLAWDWRAGLGMALELWMAAGLLRLARPGEWGALAVAATVVVVRHLAGAGLRAGPAGGGSYRSMTKRASTSSPAGVDARRGAGSPPGPATP